MRKRIDVTFIVKLVLRRSYPKRVFELCNISEKQNLKKAYSRFPSKLLFLVSPRSKIPGKIFALADLLPHNGHIGRCKMQRAEYVTLPITMYLKIIEIHRGSSFHIHRNEGISNFTPLRAHLDIMAHQISDNNIL